MRVLQVIDSLAMGGAEKLLLDSIPLYVKKGVQIDIALLQDDDYPFTKELEKQNCCKIYKLSKGSVYNPFLIFKLVKVIDNYDVVHVHLFPAQYWVVLAKILTFSRIKLIFTEHSTSNRRILNPIFRFIDKLFYKSYYNVIAISAPVHAMLSDTLKLATEKIKIIYNGVDVDKHVKAKALDKEQFFNNESIILIQVSSFSAAKDQKSLIRTLKLLPEKYKLILVGVGELEQECKLLVKQLNLINRVKFLGRRLDVPELLKTSDIVVQSSHWEGFGLAVVEGMSAGKPVIASDVKGMADIVKGAGLLFAKGNEKELAGKILELADKDFYHSVVKKCQDRAEQYSIDKMVNKYIELYEETSKNN